MYNLNKLLNDINVDTTPKDIGTIGCNRIEYSQRFRCRNGKCVHKNYVCDNFNHCGDDSDEQNCSKYLAI